MKYLLAPAVIVVIAVRGQDAKAPEASLQESGGADTAIPRRPCRKCYFFFAGSSFESR
jgi:hypothetical protein